MSGSIVLMMRMVVAVVLVWLHHAYTQCVGCIVGIYTNRSGKIRTQTHDTQAHIYIRILINKSAGATCNATDDRCLIWNWRKSYPLIAIKHEYRMLHSWEAITSTKYVLLLFRFVLQLLLVVSGQFCFIPFFWPLFTESQCFGLINNPRRLHSFFYIHSTRFALPLVYALLLRTLTYSNQHTYHIHQL